MNAVLTTTAADRYFEDYEVGATYELGSVTVTVTLSKRTHHVFPG